VIQIFIKKTIRDVTWLAYGLKIKVTTLSKVKKSALKVKHRNASHDTNYSYCDYLARIINVTDLSIGNFILEKYDSVGRSRVVQAKPVQPSVHSVHPSWEILHKCGTSCCSKYLPTKFQLNYQSYKIN